MDNQYGSEAASMARLAQIYEHNMNRLAENIRQDFETETAQYKNEMTDFVQQNVKSGLDSVLKNYVADMDGARARMVEQTQEFNSYLNEINRKNRQLAQRSWMITTACLAALAVLLACGSWYAASLGGDIRKKKEEMALLELLGSSDIVRCGEALCAKTEKAGSNDYRVIRKRP